MPHGDRILVIGAAGMLGGYLMAVLMGRGLAAEPLTRSDFDPLRDPVETVQWGRYASVINALGAVPQKGYSEAVMRRVNGEFPAAAAPRCRAWVQVSTDCVFSGKRGSYSVHDQPDPVDEYGRSKLAGEVGLVVRGSFVGEGSSVALLETVLSRTEMPGYSDHLWNGVTALAMAETLADLVVLERTEGLVHVAGPETMSKLDLCRAIDDAYRHGAELSPVRAGFRDRTLVPTHPVAEPILDQLCRQREFERWTA